MGIQSTPGKSIFPDAMQKSDSRGQIATSSVAMVHSVTASVSTNDVKTDYMYFPIRVVPFNIARKERDCEIRLESLGKRHEEK